MTTERDFHPSWEGSLYLDEVTDANWIGEVSDFSRPQRTVNTGQFATRQQQGRLMRGQQFKNTISPGSGSFTLVEKTSNAIQGRIYASVNKNQRHMLYEVYHNALGADVDLTYSWEVEFIGWEPSTPSEDVVTVQVSFIDVGSTAPLIAPTMPRQTVSKTGAATTFDLEPYISALSTVTLTADDANNNVTVTASGTTVTIDDEATSVAGDTDIVTVTITDAENQSIETIIPVAITA